MSIPSYRRNRDGSVSLTFWGDEPPAHFAALGVEYAMVRKCRVRRRADGAWVLTCGHVSHEDARPRWCPRCGGQVVGR